MSTVVRFGGTYERRVRFWTDKHAIIGPPIYWTLICVGVPVFIGLYTLEIFVAVIETGFQKLRKKFSEQSSKEVYILDKYENLKRRRQANNAVRPLSSVRPRTLTILSSNVGNGPDVVNQEEGRLESTTKTRSNMQNRHTFARQSIHQTTIDQFGYSIGRNHIHIVRRRRRLGHVVCPASDPTDPNRRDLCSLTLDPERFYVPTAWPLDSRLLSLIRSCRQIYSEAIDVLYSENTFSFNNFEIFNTFYDTLLPHRRKLISSIHLDIALPDSRARGSYLPARDPWSYLWSEELPGQRDVLLDCFRIINDQLHLKSFLITTGFVQLPSSDVPWEKLMQILRVLNEAPVKKAFVVRSTYGPLGMSHASLDAELLGEEPHFEWRSDLVYQDPFTLSAFLIPFDVQCLHCSHFTILRKGARGYAEILLTRIGPHPVGNHQLAAPALTRYWTFHTLCGGWIEFQYDWLDEEWSVTQGARQINDEDAQSHLAEHGSRYPEMGTVQERMKGLRVRDHPIVWQPSYSWESSMTTIDLPNMATLFRNGRWTEDCQPHDIDWSEIV